MLIQSIKLIINLVKFDGVTLNFGPIGFNFVTRASC